MITYARKQVLHDKHVKKKKKKMKQTKWEKHTLNLATSITYEDKFLSHKKKKFKNKKTTPPLPSKWQLIQENRKSKF